MSERRAWIIIGVIGFVALAGWILGSKPRTFDPPPAASPEGSSRSGELLPWKPRPSPHREQDPDACRARAARRCVGGDVWWVDTCGEAYEVAQSCGHRRCVDDACETDDPACDGVSTGWRCEGDWAIGCFAGKAFEIDCAARDASCVLTDDGPVCRDVRGSRCTDERPRCVDNVLLWCEDGEEQAFDCGQAGARCIEATATVSARCVRGHGWERRPSVSCGACGCSRDPQPEVCDGRDNDADGEIDEDTVCEPIKLQAWVMTDGGDAQFRREALELEVDRVNQLFAEVPGWALTFVLGDVVFVDRPAWLDIDDRSLGEVLDWIQTQLPSEFVVPVVWTESLHVEGVPRPGLATPPNGACGGHRRIDAPQPIEGGMVIAKRHWQTTLAHELGHYLGLCHTHVPSPDRVVVVDDAGEACQAACELEGDGLCDTPIDPGPPHCELADGCTVECRSRDVLPDPTNVMAYYPPCRTAFTEEQLQTMRHVAQLRRAWWSCRSGDGCLCSPTDPGSCPEQMSCRPYHGNDQTAWMWRCGLDGAGVPGARCEGSQTCGQGSLCVSIDQVSRCVRPCRLLEDEVGCGCRVVPGVEVPLCETDFASSQ